MAPKLSLKVAFNKWIKEIDTTERDHFQLDGKGIFCNACSKRFDTWDRKSQLTQHIQTEYHKKSVKLKVTSGKQLLVTSEPLVNEFSQELCSAFLAADIPWSKLENPVLKAFLEKYTKRIIPSEWQLRTKFLQVEYETVMNKIREEISGSRIWLGIDETTDRRGRFIVNVLVGKLDGEEREPHLIMSREIQVTNNVTITQFVMDALHFIWPGKREDEIGQQFAMLLTDGVPYMLKAGRNLKKVYPNLFHVTCIAHALNRVCELVRSKFKDVDKLLASIKAIFKKATSRKRAYKEAFPDLAFPPEPNLTRWGTWLEAAVFSAQHYNQIKQVIMSFDREDAASIKTAQKLMQKEELKNNLIDIAANYSFLGLAITKMQERGITLTESVKVIDDVMDRLKENVSDTGQAVFAKMQNVLEKNPDFSRVIEVAKSLRGEPGASSLEPLAILAMKVCPLTTVEVERSFSMHKAILSDRRTNFKLENLEMYLCCHFEYSVNSN